MEGYVKKRELMFYVCASNDCRNNVLKVGKVNVLMEKLSFALLQKGFERESESFEEQSSWSGRRQEFCAERQVKRKLLWKSYSFSTLKHQHHGRNVSKLSAQKCPI